MLQETLPAPGSSGVQYWVAGAIFVVAFVAIVSERIHKTKVALAGAALMMSLSILHQNEAFHSEHLGVDWNVVFLLISMMILVNIIGRTGIFEWAAIKAAKLAQGRPFKIMVFFVILTAIASALLDNVTTILLIAPVTLLICEELDLEPTPFIIAEALSSNIGGTATLIGDPPNIMIASRANLTFTDFIINLAPIVVVMMIAFLIVLKVLYGKKMVVDEVKRQRILAMDESKMIKDPKLAKKSLIVLGLTLTGFSLHGALHLEPATIALAGASLLLLISRGDPHKILAEIEWNTLFFFIGLFIIVGGIVKVGLIRDISEQLIKYTHPTETSMETTAYTVLWGSAILSAIVDNIPYVATMSPLVIDMANTVFHDGAHTISSLPAETIAHPVLEPVWWSLALGACLGGNGTAIGASANVVVIGIATRSGVKITFMRFLKFGLPVMFLTVAIAHVYVALRYY